MRIPSEDLQKRIVDTIRYRFYDRLDLYDVYRWLDNFEDSELEMAVSVFERLEYSQTGEKTGNDTGKDTGNEGTPDQYVLRLLEIVGNQTLTVKRMMEILKLKGDDNFRKKYLNPAINDGYIALLYPDKPRKKGQSYYLTELGKALLKNE